MTAAEFDIGDNLLQAIVTLVGLATLIVQQWRTGKAVKETKQTAESAHQTAAFAAQQLVNNGGSSVKDAVDRIESHLGTRSGEIPLTPTVERTWTPADTGRLPPVEGT